MGHRVLAIVWVLILVAVSFAASELASIDAATDWCDSLVVKLAQQRGASYQQLPVGIYLSNSGNESLFISDVRGRFNWSDVVYDWGGISLGAGQSGVVTTIVNTPLAYVDTAFTVLLTIRSRAASSSQESDCRVVGTFTVFNQGIPSTGFEGSGLWLYAGLFAIGLTAIVLVAVVLFLRRRIGSGQSRPPSTRCPRCGQPVVGQSESGPWQCPHCGWQ